MVRGPGFDYPRTIIANKPRRLNHEWFEQYDWLEYSPKVDKAFCHTATCSEIVLKGKVEMMHL